VKKGAGPDGQVCSVTLTDDILCEMIDAVDARLIGERAVFDFLRHSMCLSCDRCMYVVGRLLRLLGRGFSASDPYLRAVFRQDCARCVQAPRWRGSTCHVQHKKLPCPGEIRQYRAILAVPIINNLGPWETPRYLRIHAEKAPQASASANSATSAGGYLLFLLSIRTRNHRSVNCLLLALLAIY
jgi:hypothetical protein